MKITVYYVLIISGRVLDRLVGGVKENRLSEKQKSAVIKNSNAFPI